MVSKHFHKLEEDGSFLFDGETLCDLVLDVGGERVVGGEMAGGVHTEELKESVNVFVVVLAVGKKALD